MVMRNSQARVDLLDWSQFERAVEIGCRHTKERLAPMPVEG